MSAHESSAWWRLAFFSLFGVCLLWWLFFTDHAIDKEWGLVRFLYEISFPLVCLSASAYALRRKGLIVDERDEMISERATQGAFIALMVVIILMPYIIRGVFGDKRSITLDVIFFDFYAVACVVLVMWTEAAITVWYHLRDRRQAV
jgi:hypothetical protein